jgi:PII-like signaling protein
VALVPATRARVYLRDSATHEGRPAHALIVEAFREAGVEDLSIHHGIMGFDRASEVYAARRFPTRPLRFPVDLPVVVEAVGSREGIEASLPRVREVLDRGLITLTEVELYEPGGVPGVPPEEAGG